MLSGMMEDTKGSLLVKPNGALMVNGNLVASPVRFIATNGSKNIAPPNLADLRTFVHGTPDFSKTKSAIPTQKPSRKFSEKRGGILLLIYFNSNPLSRTLFLLKKREDNKRYEQLKYPRFNSEY